MPLAALEGLAGLAGWTRDSLGAVRFENADPVLQTPFRLAAAAAAALAAGGIAAARLRGEAQEIAVDLRQAAASLRSFRYLELAAAPDPIDKLTGFYPTEDGRFFYIHCNFPHHREGALRLLGASVAERETLAERTRRRSGAALEDAFAEAGLPGGLARSAAEWLDHPHAHALSALPVLEIVKIGEAPPVRLPAGDRPLSGVRVLDLTRVIAGPTGARTLASHGAEVLKITAPELPDSGVFEFDTGLGKRAAFLDLRRGDARETLFGLVQGADVFVQSYRPGTLEARGFGPEALAERRPGIVYVTLSAFGHAGPWAARRGFDSIVQTVSGMALEQGGGKPRLTPCSAIDYVSGYLMAFGAMVALGRRAREGGSWLVRCSLAQTGRWLAAQGRVSADGVPAEFPAPELAGWLGRAETPAGPLTYLRPALRMSRTPPRWERPSVPLGYHKPEW